MKKNKENIVVNVDNVHDDVGRGQHKLSSFYVPQINNDNDYDNNFSRQW